MAQESSEEIPMEIVESMAQLPYHPGIADTVNKKKGINLEIGHTLP